MIQQDTPVTLVTGAAGFIGFHVCKRLLEDGRHVLGIDNLNPYYDVRLKEARLAQLRSWDRFQFQRVDICSRPDMDALFAQQAITQVIHLAAQAGVPYSLINPAVYIDTNLKGFFHIMEACRQRQVRHLVFASSSSVYGGNAKMPFSVHDSVDHPISLYAATKKANELMAHAYAHLHNLPCTGLRFFTVYGPWGRPDMSLFIFTKAIIEEQPITVYNQGDIHRDFTYIDDIVEGVIRILAHPPAPDPAWDRHALDPGTSFAPYRLYNIGSQEPLPILEVIAILEGILGKRATVRFAPMKPGDVPASHANVEDFMQDTGFKPSTPIQVGLQRFVAWYRAFYGV